MPPREEPGTAGGPATSKWTLTAMLLGVVIAGMTAALLPVLASAAADRQLRVAALTAATAAED